MGQSKTVITIQGMYIHQSLARRETTHEKLALKKKKKLSEKDIQGIWISLPQTTFLDEMCLTFGQKGPNFEMIMFNII